MIRLILVTLTVVGYLILTIPMLGILWLIRRKNQKKADLISLRMVQGAFKLILFLAGTKVTVIGEENVPKDQPVLYIGNHRSFFDILLTYSRCPGLTGYVAKDGMLKVPLLSTWMKRLYCLFLNRTDMKQGLQTILKGIEQIKNGISMCIFPEGTRNKGDNELELLPFHEGSFKMAEKTGCPIITMSMNNTAEIFESHFPWVHSCHVILEYGKPIYPKELSREERKFLGAYCQKQIQETLVRNQKLL
ncbi:MAG: lysophospholipid acyltransferase family protein [Candidatus Limivivens sp.]|nr:lysophospholipid acyltransferase family protein [Candidatus Limivivens sp.]